MTYHTPVLLQEVIKGLQVCPGKRFVDATCGGGGHTKEILAMGAQVLAIDTDPDACEEIKKLGSACIVVKGNFRNIAEIVQAVHWHPVDGVLFDLGVSSHQLDEANRGFSYRFADALLDLRLDQTDGIPAREVVNTATREELEYMFRTYGEEESYKELAQAIVEKRKERNIVTTGDLFALIKDVKKTDLHKTGSRVFQALRIYVNDEVKALQEGLEEAERIVRPGGRIAIISFHSLEDRIVKQWMGKSGIQRITKKPITPQREELTANIRSRSAKLRIAEIV